MMGVFIKCIFFLLGCYSIIQISNGQLNRHFRCNNGRYIRNEWFCDGDRDCPDREDEGAGCRRYGCGKGKFACISDQSCKNITTRCNTVKDCDDGSDELNCGDEINVKNCTTREKFLCHDGLRCLDLEYTCDGSCNCFDCSDENENCSKTDDDLMKKCPNAYFVTAYGPQCLCNSSNDQSAICRNIESCDSCEQRCLRYKNNVQCTCYEGFHSFNSSSGTACRSDVWFGTVLFYVTVLKIKSLNVTSTNATTVQNGVHNCSALSAANNYVYYATGLLNNRGSIFKSSFTAGKAETIIETDFPITSIAVDYVTNNVYFTSNGSISVCKNNGLICWKLKCCGINYVTLAPKSGLMFYLQAHAMYSQNSALVMKSNMDGSDETILADDVYKGNLSIVVDEAERKLYLLEANDVITRIKIDRISFDGETKESTPGRGIRSLGVNSGDIFFTVDQRNDIYHAKNYRSIRPYIDSSEAFFRDNSTSTAKFLYAYNGLIQRASENPCLKSCTGLCLTKPSSSPFALLSYTCLCNNFTSTSENRWCSNIPPPAASHGVLVAFILAFVVLGILGAAGYFMFLKQNWYQYYMTFQRWQRNKRDQRIVTNNLDE